MSSRKIRATKESMSKPCGRCGADPGDRCVSKQGNRMGSYVHRARAAQLPPMRVVNQALNLPRAKRLVKRPAGGQLIGLWQDHIGRLYYVQGVYTHTDSGDLLVAYYCLDSGGDRTNCAKPYKQWFKTIWANGKEQANYRMIRTAADIEVK